MRVLFVDNPEPTTFQTMVPLAWAMRTAGHEVRFASQPRFTDTITQSGLTAVPVGRDYDMYRLTKLAMGIQETQIAALVSEDDDDEEEDEAGAIQGVPGLHAPFDVVEDPALAVWDRMLPAYTASVTGELTYENFPIIAGLVEFAKQWQPDLVVWEPSTYAGPIAAKVCGAAHARIVATLDVLGVTREHFLRLRAEQPPGAREDPLADWFAGYGRKYGFEFSEDMATGHFTINQLAPSLSILADLTYLPMQHIPYGGPAVVPKWLWTPPEQPRVALTLGTTAAQQFGGYTVNVQDALDSLADLEIEVVATLSDEFRDNLKRVPDNARIIPYVPLHALAPTCSAVINHAGAGTMLTIARYGVPQLSLPWDLDEPQLARNLTAQGSSIMIPGDEARGEDISAAVLRLLHEPGYAAGAAALSAEIRGLPSPNALVPQLEELTAKHRVTG